MIDSTSRWPPPLVQHLIALVLFAVATAVWLSPLAGSFAAAIPGPAPGDNITFVWNVWWVRYAVLHRLPLFFSPMLLYPFGADLTLHTHTLLPALAVSGIANPVAAQNLLTTGHLLLNFVCTYLLAWREARSWAAAVAAAMIYGWSPYIAGHLVGHFNLIAAWVLPLAALLTLRAIAEPTGRRGATLGLALGATAYVDYYYFLYGCLLALLLALASCMSVVRRPRPIANAAAVATRCFWFLAIASLAAAAAVALFGGSVWQIGSRTISVRSVRNPIAVAWLCGMLALVIHFSSTRRATFDSTRIYRLGRHGLIAPILIVVVLSPLLWHTVTAARAGSYVTQRYLWRSAPSGIDLTTLMAGNPSSALYGRYVRPIYQAWSVNLVEHVAWIGPGVVALTLIGLKATRGATRWLLPLTVFGLWAIGPSVQVLGSATPLWMPAVLVRWIPIVANARIPARAIVVVYLACAMLAAYGVQFLLANRRTALASGLLALVLLDLAPAPPPIVILPRPGIAAAMEADATAGAVLHVPFGLRDGFGETGRLDPQAMWLQTIHHRPIVGGFVARLPPGIADRYLDMPVIGSLLRLSSGERLTTSEIDRDRAVANSLAAEGFRYVLVNRLLANTDLQRYVERVFPFAAPIRDGEYILLSLDPARTHASSIRQAAMLGR